MDVCLRIKVGCIWWKATFSLFITLSCLIPALQKAQHLLRLIQHQSTMKSCLFFSIWHPARSHLHYISCSPSPCRGSRVKKSKGMPTLHSSCPPLLPGHTCFPQRIFNYFPSRSRAQVFRSTSMTSCPLLWRTSLTCTGHPCPGIKMGMNVCLYITWCFSVSGVCCGIPFCKAPTLSCPLGIFLQQE